MAKKRLELQSKLEELFGSKKVYYQPPENLKMEYPVIRYSKSRIEGIRADDSIYTKNTRYEIIVIDRKPDNDVIDKILELPLTSHDRHYVADSLNHDIITIYY